MKVDDLTINEAFALYVANLESRVASGDYGQRTIDGVKPVLKRFQDAFGAQRISRCRQHDLARFLSDWPALKSGHAKKRAIVTVLPAFNWCLRRRNGRFRCLVRLISPSSARRKATSGRARRRLASVRR